jgi:protein SCO1
VALWLGLAAPAPAADGLRLPPLMDQRGTQVSLAQMRGAPVLVTFVATRCTDACPIATALFERVRERLQRRGMRATLLEVTLDPEHDTPFVLARYARSYGAGDAADWRFAGGSPAAVRTWMRTFGVTAQVGAAGVPDVHSSFVYVLDGHGRQKQTMLLSSNLVDESVHALAQAGP